MLKSIAIICAAGTLGLAAFGGYVLAARPTQAQIPEAQAPQELKARAWTVAAVGRLEPKSGEIRIAATAPGRITETFVRANDKVEEGDVLLRLEDDEARLRLVSAEAEAAVRRRERDAQPATVGREEVKRAEDALYLAERIETGARFELDFVLANKRSGTGTESQVAVARKRMVEARERVKRERTALGAALAKPGLPAPNRLEAAFTAARADVSLAESVLDKTRIRAPSAGTILQIAAKVGEVISPSVEQPLIVMGDISTMRVVAEVDETDAAKVRLGQLVTVCSDSYPGRDFDGKVTAIAPSLAPPRIGQRGPRRPTDVEVFEVMILLEGAVPLLTGMRTDVLFR
jgi:HlyD family secretion protein